MTNVKVGFIAFGIILCLVSGMSFIVGYTWIKPISISQAALNAEKEEAAYYAVAWASTSKQLTESKTQVSSQGRELKRCWKKVKIQKKEYSFSTPLSGSKKATP